MSDFSIAPLPVLLSASLLYFVSALVKSDENKTHNGTYGWAISCGLISSVLSGIIMFLQMKGKGDMVAKYKKQISIFFLLWWIFGAAIGTFEGPFTVASNGYFAGWIAFYASLKYAYITSDHVRDFTDRAVNAMKDQPAPTEGEFGSQDGAYNTQDQAEAYA